MNDAPTSRQERATLDSVGRFVVRETLGGSQFATVYRAYDPQLERDVALKVASAAVAASAFMLDEFLWEARAIADLRHPHLAAILEAGHGDGTAFISTQLVAGVSLDRYRATAGGTVSPRVAAAFVAKLARALHYAHSRGLVHRDVRPENVLVDAHGEPTLLNFRAALSLVAKAGTPRAELRGSPEYRSPELLAGDSPNVDGRADLWSLGVILYELLADRRPFLARGSALTTQILHGEHPPLHSVAKGIPRDLNAIVERCLEPSAKQRYDSCAALADDLEAFLDDRPVTARKPLWLEPFERWARRNRAIAALLAIIALLTAATLAGLAFASWSTSALNQQLEQRRAATQLAVDEANRHRLAVLESTARTTATLAESRRVSQELDDTLAQARQEDEARQAADREREAVAASTRQTVRQTKELTRSASEAEQKRGSAAAALAKTQADRPDETLRQNHLELQRKYSELARLFASGDRASFTEQLDEIPGHERHWEWWVLKELGAAPTVQPWFELASPTPLRASPIAFSDDETRCVRIQDRVYVHDLTRRGAVLTGYPRPDDSHLLSLVNHHNSILMVFQTSAVVLELPGGTLRRLNIPQAEQITKPLAALGQATVDAAGWASPFGIGNGFFWRRNHVAGPLQTLAPSGATLRWHRSAETKEFRNACVHFHPEGAWAAVVEPAGEAWLVSPAASTPPRPLRWKLTNVRGTNWQTLRRSFLAFGPASKPDVAPLLALDGPYIAIGSPDFEDTGTAPIASSEYSPWLSRENFANLVPGGRRRLAANGTVSDAWSGVELLRLGDFLPVPNSLTAAELELSPKQRWLMLTGTVAFQRRTFFLELPATIQAAAEAASSRFPPPDYAIPPFEPSESLSKGRSREIEALSRARSK